MSFKIGQRYLTKSGSVGEVCAVYTTSVDMWIDGKMIILSLFTEVMHYNKDYQKLIFLPKEEHPEEYI